MAPRVQFYHNTPDRLALARELIARAHAGGRKAVVRLPDAVGARQLDQLLWTQEPLAFIPHVGIDSALAAETPIILATAGSTARWPHEDMLFNLATDVPQGVDAFRLVVEIVGRNEAEKLPARARWTAYKQMGLALKAFDAERREAI
ncbi:DNA polymerase III subunit chi [Thauera sinica]|uniref:DNA polymerase III subunit chi n=1 Tax=Thauera sinica TaxID=2665146 RepID=A0ABW1AM65_9RHOO|nr:DNA polymerase III subunit chi [Thauera sp. K11]ATE59184.1 DNA polymerase III subunit chi [Thauera sp. K11]